MPNFSSYDGTVLAYRCEGSGRPLVCVPGGPGRDSVYLGTLGGLDSYRTLVLYDNRGSGQSADTADPSDVDSYRADRLVRDLEALRVHLGLDTMDLWGHSGGAHIAALYAATHPHRLGSLSLICGGQRVPGVDDEDAFMRVIDSKTNEPWYADARAALDEWDALGRDVTPEIKLRAAPLFYGRPWTPEKRAHAAADPGQRRNPLAVKHFADESDPAEMRAALGKVAAPVLVYAGALDNSPCVDEARRLAAVFPNGRTVIQPDAGHFPWLDDPAFFVQAMLEHLP